MSLDGMFNLFGASSFISSAGVGLDAYGKYQEMELYNQAALQNAATEEANAAYYDLMGSNAIARSEKEAADHRRSIDVLKGEQRTGYAASGVKVDTGSALDVAMDTAKWGEYDAQSILYNGLTEKAGYDQQAANSRASAKNYRSSIRNSALAAGSVALNGITSLSKFGNW